ncbi:hypothetical protein BJ912DRAFT_1002128 [Pholiota molesta]|nr:hypothetical protein BJ912DRAFT_1002128 [Pholiota molesta]
MPRGLHHPQSSNIRHDAGMLPARLAKYKAKLSLEILISPHTGPGPGDMSKSSNRKGQAASPKNLAATSAPVVILFGETGCGKSHFICVAGKPKLDPLPPLGEPGDLHACTTSVAPFNVEKSTPHHSPATYVQLIDTPGFNNEDISNYDIVGGIVKWLRTEPNITIAGILYLQDTNNPSTTYKENITRAFPGAQWITWSSVVQNGILNSVTGAHPFDNTNDSAWRIITAAMREATSKGVTLTRGQLAKKLEEISSQPAKSSDKPKKSFGSFL